MPAFETRLPSRALPRLRSAIAVKEGFRGLLNHLLRTLLPIRSGAYLSPLGGLKRNLTDLGKCYDAVNERYGFFDFCRKKS